MRHGESLPLSSLLMPWEGFESLGFSLGTPHSEPLPSVHLCSGDNYKPD